MDEASELKRRKDRLGLSEQRLAELAGVSRGSVRRAISTGDVYGHTLARITAALDAFEYEVGADVPDPVVSTVTFPDGTVVTFSGSPDGVAEAVRRVVGGSS